MEFEHSFGKTDEGTVEISILHAMVVGVGLGGRTVVEKKGVTEYIVTWVIKRLAMMGLGDVRLRVDQESALLAVANKVAERRTRKTIVEACAIQSPQSLGGVRRYHRLLQEEARAVWMQYQEGAEEIEQTPAMAAWIIRHASWLLYRYHVNKELKANGAKRS